jgi:plastocyanin/mono/diheme cytochrome c family protein
MSDTPELGPGEQLPVPRPPVEPAPVERFTAVPSVHAVELTPERAAQVVRQSSNARWVGFLAVVVVVLFVAIYWFYELAPLGFTQSRLEAETDAQQVTSVERGYNLFEANCARCHGANGQGGIGPALNRQDKLFAHLSVDYLDNVLSVGGRYVCGNPNSLMPIWSNEGHPPGPLNYTQLEDLIAFIRAPNTQTYTIRDPDLFEPKIDPLTGKVQTFTGWRDPNYKPAPGATPYPACWQDEFITPSGSPSTSGSPSASGSTAPSGSAAPSASAGGSATTIDIIAQNIAFNTASITAPAGAPFVIAFDNQDAGTSHNVAIKDSTGKEIFKGDIFPGIAQRQYQVPALAAGTYTFVCDVHPNMTGTLTAQ